MLSQERQARLDPLLKLLAEHPAIVTARQDDFDSTAVNVFLDLKPTVNKVTALSDSAVFRFAAHLRTIKAYIRSSCKKFGIGFNWLDWPAKDYRSISGQREDLGYDQSHIKIEVFV